MEGGLEALLNCRYEETVDWIETTEECERMADKLISNLRKSGKDEDETVIEKIVSLIPESESTNYFSSTPILQSHDPLAPDISRYFLVFRQGFSDYARLCVEKRDKSQKNSGRDTENISTMSPSIMITTESSINPNSNNVMPLESTTPMLATASVLSGSPSLDAINTNSNNANTTMINSNSNNNINLNSSSKNNNTFKSYRLYRTYASFYHAIAGSNIERSKKSKNGKVQTQRQTTEETKAYNTGQFQATPSPAQSYSNSNTPAIDAAIGWKSVKPQNHSFKGHPLPSPELPKYDEINQPTVKYVIFAVHGVGQRAWRKMGFHFNKDCDELRNVLLEAAQLRGVPSGSLTVLPVSWRTELDLAGNFTFGDEEVEVEESEQDDRCDDKVDTEDIEVNRNSPKQDYDGGSNTPPESDLNLLSIASVFQGQFSEILERLALESIPAVRSVLSDATMDILLYVSPKHFERIIGAVMKEILRLYRLFMHWNPGYEGEFSFIAHSLGSALVADLLSWTVQPDEFIKRAHNNNNTEEEGLLDQISLFKQLQISGGRNQFPFKVDKFFAMGSPLGVFHLLKHHKPIGCSRSPYIDRILTERMKRWQFARQKLSDEQLTHNLPNWTVYNCKLFYNLFHPHDPVAHRFENLTISKARDQKSATPPPLKIPYHKSGLTKLKMDLEAKFARAKDDWSRSINSFSMKIPTWLGGSKRSDTPATEEQTDHDLQDVPNFNNTTTSLVDDDNPLAAFNHHFRRIDFSLQDSFIENPYLSALGAHFGYWSDLDIAAFVVSELLKEN